MKHLFKLMTLALLVVSCGGKKDNVPTKPVVTADMYSVTANAETGVVLFKFLNADYSPFWSVTDPNGQTLTFTDREVTKKYTTNGNYSGSLMVYGTGGQSDPVTFEFSINTPEPEDAKVTAAKTALSGKTMQVKAFGWWGDGWEYFDDPVPDYTAGNKVTFGTDGKLTYVLGEAGRIYNDGVAEGEVYTVPTAAKWGVVKEEDKVLLVFSNGGFPLMLAGKGGVTPDDLNYHFGLNEKWTVTSVEEGVVRVDIYQSFNEQYLTVFLAPVE